MYEVTTSKQFRTSFKKLKKSGNFKSQEFELVIEFLVQGKDLPQKYHDHFLKGNLLGKKECHITNNMLLIYDRDDSSKTITLMDIGTHAKLFGL